MGNLGFAELMIILCVLLVLSLGAAGIVIYFIMRSSKQNPVYPQAPNIICSQCGLSLPSNSEYCNRCGKAVTKA